MSLLHKLPPPLPPAPAVASFEREKRRRRIFGRKKFAGSNISARSKEQAKAEIKHVNFDVDPKQVAQIVDVRKKIEQENVAPSSEILLKQVDQTLIAREKKEKFKDLFSLHHRSKSVPDLAGLEEHQKRMLLSQPPPLVASAQDKNRHINLEDLAPEKVVPASPLKEAPSVTDAFFGLDSKGRHWNPKLKDDEFGFKVVSRALLGGAVDVIVIESSLNPGSFRCTPFYVRFGYFSCKKYQPVEVLLNDQPCPELRMMIDETGMCFFDETTLPVFSKSAIVDEMSEIYEGLGTGNVSKLEKHGVEVQHPHQQNNTDDSNENEINNSNTSSNISNNNNNIDLQRLAPAGAAGDEKRKLFSRRKSMPSMETKKILRPTNDQIVCFVLLFREKTKCKTLFVFKQQTLMPLRKRSI